MGREWLHWVAGGRPSTRRRRLTGEHERTSSAGCMCAVFQLFDLQHHPFSYQPDTHLIQQEATTSTAGVEAPEEPASMKDQEISNFSVGINQIKTRVALKSRTEDNLSSDCSPGTAKTPNLVARLMGLELLPECNNSPTPSSSNNSKPSKKSHIINPNKDNMNNIIPKRSPHLQFSDDDITIGARSSSARVSDFEYHRLSLQLNKENHGAFAISVNTRGKSAKSREDENTSPARHFAKQIVNKAKERVSRKVGLVDITNTNYREDEEKFRRDQNLVVIHQPSKKNNPNTLENSLDIKKKIVASSGTKSSRNTIRSGRNENNPSGMSKLQLAPQSYDYSLRSKKSEPFVRRVAKNKTNKFTDEKKKNTKILGKSEYQNISGPTLLPVKNDLSPLTKLPQKQVSDALSSKRNTQLSCKSSLSYKHLSLQPDQIPTAFPDSNNGCATTNSAAAAVPEYKYYLQKILKRAGKWHTASHPLDPSIFYYLELFDGSGPVAETSGILSRRCNRKLIFQLVDELLAEILKPYSDLNPRTDYNIPFGIDQFGLCDELCEKIGDFPAADCRVLEDIDSLVETDLCKLRVNGFLEEETESLVCEIEGEIMERLVRETVAVAGGGGRAEVKVKQT